MKTSNVFFSIAIYVLAILSIIAIVSITALPLSIIFGIIMNIMAYKMVLQKYKKNPNRRVENDTNDMIMLYLCKTVGCLLISLCLCFLMMMSSSLTIGGLFCGIFIFFVILFKVTPSVKKGVRTIQDNYIYNQINNTKES